MSGNPSVHPAAVQTPSLPHGEPGAPPLGNAHPGALICELDLAPRHNLRESCGMAPETAPQVPGEDERAIAARLYNDTWTLLRQEARTAREDDRMLHMAHASRFHWDSVGTDQNRAIGEWQVSRVYATLGHGSSAVFHAHRAIDYAQTPGNDDWVMASAYEGLARAYAVAGDLEAARQARDHSLALLEAITDDEDRKVIAADIDTLPA